MLNAILNNNEVRNAAGTAIIMQSQGTVGRTHTYTYVGSDPRLVTTLTIKHQEVGTGARLVRESLVAAETCSIGADGVTIVKSRAQLKVSAPIGAVNSMAPVTDAVAYLLSFVGTTGTSTLLYNGTGTGAAAVLAGAI